MPQNLNPRDGQDVEAAVQWALAEGKTFEIEKGTITTVTAPPSGEAAAGAEKRELKQFTLNITTTCP